MFAASIWLLKTLFLKFAPLSLSQLLKSSHQTMRNLWRFLVARNYSSSLTSRHFKVSPVNSKAAQLSSLIYNRGFRHDAFPLSYTSRSFTSEASLETSEVEKSDLLVDLFNKFDSLDDIKKDVESRRLEVSHGLIIKALHDVRNNPDIAKRMFSWVVSDHSERLSSKTYNSMLVIYGVNGLVQEFWDLFDVMRKKGYGVSKWVFDRVLEKFQSDGLERDMERLQGIFASGSVDNSVEKVTCKIARIIKSDIWDENVESALQGLYSSELVKMVLEKIDQEPMKAFIFFRWLEESGLCKHDERTYNAMLMILGTVGSMDRFWKVANEMRSAGYEMEVATYVSVLARFCKRKMIKDSVDLYEFAMNGANKPSLQDCTFLLRKIVAGKKLDMELFSRVVRIYTDGGNSLTNSTLTAILKSLNGVGRVGECNKILKAMKDGGYTANSTLQSKIAFNLSSLKKNDEAGEFMEIMDQSMSTSNFRTWLALVEGQCVAGDLEKASETLGKMVEREGIASADRALEVVVNAFCSRNRAIEAFKLLSDMFNKKEVKPWHSTYKTLITKLLVQGGFKEALNLLCLMKHHGFPPYLDPFVEYVSKNGTADEAISFLKGMTVQRFPSTSVVLRVFEAFFKAKRHGEAQDLLSKSPGYIRNHVDVLNLFYTMKSGKAASTTCMAA